MAKDNQISFFSINIVLKIEKTKGTCWYYKEFHVFLHSKIKETKGGIRIYVDY